MILTIKEHYFRPMYYRSPIENSFYLGRSLADLTDRHYALFANNQHPLQLYVYEEYNKFLRTAHNKDEQENLKYVNDRMGQVMDDRSRLLNTKEGESLSIDDISDVYMQVMGEARAKSNMSLTTRSKTGEISDYLEVRRPFGAAQ
jgi:succinate dehydrogenase/fumarate reductase flavoprotein subunit